MSSETIVSSRSRKNAISRWLYQHFVRKPFPARQVLMIMGAQRSGTTLFSRIFDDLYFADVYGEFSALSSDDKFNLRLNHREKVLAELSRSRASLVVMKPLVESQRAPELLADIPRSKVVWLYRDFRDVAASSILKFGDEEGGLSHIRAFVDTEFAKRDSAAWKSENASEDTVALLEGLYSEKMNAHDAASLFWYARNRLFFDLDLAQRSDVMLIRYEDFVCHPFITIAYVLEQFGIYELKSPALYNIGLSSVGKGETVEISGEVAGLCNELKERLDLDYKRTRLGMMTANLR